MAQIPSFDDASKQVLPYFKVKSFHVSKKNSNNEFDDFIVSDDVKDFILNEVNYLSDKFALHYNSPLLYKYVDYLKNKYPQDYFEVYYKYEYFNHDHVNTYMNRLKISNGVVTDHLIG